MKNGKKILIFVLTFIVFGYIGYSVLKGTIADDVHEIITYDDFGAVGDGRTNDYTAIKAAHDYANQVYLDTGVMNTVYACAEDNCSNKTYNLGSSNGEGAIDIITNVDWKNAKFVVDDYVDSNSDSVNDVDVTDNLFRIVSPLNVFSRNYFNEIEINDESKLKTGEGRLKFDSNILAQLSDNEIIKPGCTNLSVLVDAFYNRNIVDTEFYNDENVLEIEKHFRSAQRWGVLLVNSNKMFIRKGANQDSGANQTETIIIDSKTGNVLSDVLWTYDDLTEIRVWPIPDDKITVKNGSFTTHTYNAVYTSDSSGNAKKNPYSQRNIYVYYTGNVELSGIKHYLNENTHKYTHKYQNVAKGNLYYGFLKLDYASFVNIKNNSLTPHTFAHIVSNNTIQTGGDGTYDFTMGYSNNIFIDNLLYTCDIRKADDSDWDWSTCYGNNMLDESKWGITGTNYTKNVYITNSKLNRIDAHRGINNLYVENTTIGVGYGRSALTLGGSGYFYGEKLKIDAANHVLKLRDDYGSTWNGTIVLNDINFIINSNSTHPAVIYSANEQNWDFGYESYFPNLYVNKLNIDTTTKNATGVQYVTFLQLSNLYSNNNVTTNKSNPRNLYYFKDNIYLNNLTPNGNDVKLFTYSFPSSAGNTLVRTTYGGINVVNIKIPSGLENNLKSVSDPKFKVVGSMTDKTTEVKNYFSTLRDTLVMPEQLKPLIGNINLSSGNLNEEIDENRFIYTATVETDNITVNLKAAYIGTYTSFDSQTFELKNGLNTINFKVMNSSGDETEYTLQITKEGSSLLSDVNTLESISLTNGILNESFNRDTTEYTASASGMTVTVNVTKTDEKSTVSGVGEVNLRYGTNNIEIVVTSESGISKKYIITIIKEFILSDEDITGDFIYNGDEKFIYIGNREINYSILNYIKVPSDLNKEVDVYNNMMVISNSSEVLSRIRIFNFSVTGLNINGKNIDLDEGLTYDNFINKINMVDGLNYRVYKGNEVITTGNMEDGMILKIYYDDLELDSYSLRLTVDDDLVDPEIIFDDSINVIENSNYIAYGTGEITVAEFRNLVDSVGGDLFIKNNGSEKKLTDKIMTGDVIELYVSNELKTRYVISVKGDVTGDGNINSDDVIKMSRHIVKGNILTGDEFILAADMNNNGRIDINDIVRFVKNIIYAE